jgi:hypothetical protein
MNVVGQKLIEIWLFLYFICMAGGRESGRIFLKFLPKL